MTKNSKFDIVDKLEDDLLSSATSQASEKEKLDEEREAIKLCIKEYQNFHKLLEDLKGGLSTAYREISNTKDVMTKLANDGISEKRLKKIQEQYDKITKEALSALDEQSHKMRENIFNGRIVLSRVVFLCIIISLISLAMFFVCMGLLNYYFFHNKEVWELFGLTLFLIIFISTAVIYVYRND